MFGCLETNIPESSGEHVVPVVGTAEEAIESFVEESVFILLVSRVSDRWSDHGEFIFR